MAREVYMWCKATQSILPAHEARRRDDARKDTLANIAHGYIPDEMPATKHPLDGKYYTSKSKFREKTISEGYDEVGTAYENGYEPEKKREAELKEYVKGFKEELRGRIWNS